MRATVIFVHGAFISDSAWWWKPVADLLERQEIASIAVDLPSCHETAPQGDLPATEATIHLDARAVRDAIARAEEPVVLVGHSYGGAVITEAAMDQPKVKHLVYMSACVPDGTSVIESGFTNPEHNETFGYYEDGTVDEGLGKTKSGVLMSLPDQALAQEAITRLTRQSALPFIQVPDGDAWRHIPSTFFVCTKDEDVAVASQRTHAERTGGIVEIPTNHFAHLERPDLVRDALVGVVNNLAVDATT
jgi:pimeloyl-ACP methyl ester carboxylesterase